MLIDEITIDQVKKIAKLIGMSNQDAESSNGLNRMIGKKVLIRTYSAGVWFGLLAEKSGNEVIIENARRLWRWKTKESISLSSVVLLGIDESNSKIAAPLPEIWLEAIEIAACSESAIKSIEACRVATSS